MTGEITLSSAVRSNLLSLQKTADLLGKTQGRLATGLKVNSALDDPTAFFTASALNSRASDLNRLQDFVGNAIQTLRAADEGISAITNLVEAAEATARQALQTAGSTSTAVQITGTSTVTADTAPTVTGSDVGSNFELDTVFDSTDTITINLNGVTSTINFENNGDNVAATAQSGNNYYINLDDGNGVTGTAATVTGTNTVAADAAANSGAGTGLGTSSATLTSLGFTNSDTLTINVGGSTYTVGFYNTDPGGLDLFLDLDAGNDVDDLINGIDGLGNDINASLVSNNIQLSASNTTDEIVITGSDGTVLADLGLQSAGYGSTTARTIDPSSSTLTGLAGNELTLQVGAGAVNTITFGANDSTSQVDNRVELLAAINGIAGLTAQYNANALQIDATSVASTFTVGGDAAVLTGVGSLGIAAGTRSPTGITDATFSDLAAVINTISGVNGSVASDQLTIASSSFVGDLTITANDTGTASDTLLNALGLTNSGTAGIAVVEPGNTDLNALTGNLTVQLGTGTVNTITFGTNDGSSQVNNQTELLAALNGITGLSAQFVGNALQLDGPDTTTSLTIGGSSAELTALHLTAGTTYPTTATTVTERSNFATQFDELRSQIDQLANDASYNGVNLLAGDSLTVTFNEDGTSSLGISGVTFSSSGLGIDAAENNFQLDTNINAALTDLKSATDTLRSQASQFGNNLSVVETRQDFTKELINVLETGAANLTLADTNEEGANLLALQTRQQLSSTALSLASQADQNVLRLF